MRVLRTSELYTGGDARTLNDALRLMTNRIRSRLTLRVEQSSL